MRRARIKTVERMLKMTERRAPFCRQSESGWTEDLGKNLSHYCRVHTYLLNSFGKTRLQGLHITQFGAGNGQYMHLLAHSYGAKTKAVEINLDYIREQQKRGITPNFIHSSAEATKIKKESQDVVLSDHFLCASYDDKINEEKVLREAHRILKKGGSLIVESSYIRNPHNFVPTLFEFAGGLPAYKIKRLGGVKTNILTWPFNNPLFVFKKK